MRLLELLHHLAESVLRVRDVVETRKAELDTQALEALLELLADDVAQRHPGCADLGSDDAELAGDRRG